MQPRLCSWGLAVCLLATGCLSNRRFEEVAPGVGVSKKSIDDYAKQHDLSRDEAKRRIAAEMMSANDSSPEAKAARALEVVAGEKPGGEQVE